MLQKKAIVWTNWDMLIAQQKSAKQCVNDHKWKQIILNLHLQAYNKGVFILSLPNLFTWITFLGT